MGWFIVVDRVQFDRRGFSGRKFAHALSNSLRGQLPAAASMISAQLCATASSSQTQMIGCPYEVNMQADAEELSPRPNSTDANSR
jgi:hypothetical protein